MVKELGSQYSDLGEVQGAAATSSKQYDMLHSFTGDILGEVLETQRTSEAKKGMIHPNELESIIKKRLSAKDPKNLLEKFDTWLQEHGGDRLSFETIGGYKLRLGKIFYAGWRDQLEYGMSELNKKGFVLLLIEKLGDPLTTNEKTQWQRYLQEKMFPTHKEQFGTYADHLTKLTELYRGFLTTLDDQRARILWQDISELQITNNEVLAQFKTLGIYKDDTVSEQSALGIVSEGSGSTGIEQGALVNMSEKLIELELGEDMLYQADVLSSTIHDSEKFLIDRQFGDGILHQYPVASFYKTKDASELLTQQPSSGHLAAENKKQLLRMYLHRIGQQDPQQASLMEQIWQGVEYGTLNTLSSNEKKQLLDLYVEGHLNYLIDDGLEHLLVGYVGGESKLQLRQYKQFWKSVYALDQNEVSLPTELLPTGQTEKIVFKNKDIRLNSSIQEITDLSQLFEIDFVIDTERTTLPTEVLFPDAYVAPTNKVLQEHPSGVFKRGVPYTFSESGSGKHYNGIVEILASPTRIAVYDTEKYQSCMATFQPIDFEPVVTISRNDFTSWRRQESLSQDTGVLNITKSGNGQNKTEGDGFDRLNLAYLGLLSQSQTRGEHVTGEELIEQLLQYQRQSPELVAEEHSPKLSSMGHVGRETILRNEFFQASFVADANMPEEIRSQHPAGTLIPAWINKGKIFYNKDIFEQETGLTVGQDEQGNKTFNGKKISIWIADHPQEWRSKVKPLLKKRGTHEKTHRLLEFYGIKHNPKEGTAGSIAVMNLTGTKVSLDHETICRIADGSFAVSGDGIVTVVLENGETHMIKLASLEEEISKKIPGFKFASIRKIDAQHLDQYIAAPDRFDELHATMNYDYDWETYEGMSPEEQADLEVGVDVEPEDEYLRRIDRQQRRQQSGQQRRQQPRQQLSQSEQMDALLNRFKDIAGDVNVGLEDGIVLMSKLRDSGLPGRASERVERELTHTQGNGPLELVLKGRTEGHAGDAIGKVKYIDRSVAGLNQMIADFKGQVYKFKPVHGQQQFREYVKSELETKNAKIGSRLPAWGGETFNSQFEKKYYEGDTEQFGKVAYVGHIQQKLSGTYKPTDIFYKVDMSDRGVRVSTLDGVFDQYMSWVSFMTFCLDKGLNPYTAKEFANIVDVAEPNPVEHKIGNRRDSFVSIGVLVQAIKKFPQAYKYKLEQQQKYETARLYAQFADWIPGGWDIGILSDIKADATTDLDSTISQVIESYKKRLDRGDADQQVHGSKVAGLIETEIFKNTSMSTDSRQKAAGYLLYAMQKGGGPYFRSLSNYAHTAIWVRAILGESHQQKFLAIRKQMINEFKSSNMSNDEAMDNIAKAEIMYIAKQTQERMYEKIFGTRFGRWLEEEASEFGKGSAAKGVSDSLLKKGSIYEIYDAFRGGGINNLSSNAVVAGLLAMEERVESMEHYSLFYKSLIQVIVSGYAYSFGSEARNIIKGICRRRGIPIGLFISDPHHAHKVVSVIDHIAESSADGRAYPSLSGAIKGKVKSRDSKTLHAHNFAIGGQHKKVLEAVDDRRDNYGHTVMSAFNYKNTRLTSYVSEATGESKTYIDQYFDECVFDSYKGRPDRQSDPGDGQSPFYQEGILNVASGFFEDYMLRVDADGTLRYPQTRDMWEEFGGIIGQFDSLLNRTPDLEQRKFLLKFLLKKFKQYFGSRFSSKEYAELAEAFVSDREKDQDYIDSNGDRRIRRGYRSVIRGKLLGDYYLEDREKWDVRRGQIATTIGGRRGRKGVEEGAVEAAIESMMSLFAVHTNGIDKQEMFSVLTG